MLLLLQVRLIVACIASQRQLTQDVTADRFATTVSDLAGFFGAVRVAGPADILQGLNATGRNTQMQVGPTLSLSTAERGDTHTASAAHGPSQPLPPDGQWQPQSTACMHALHDAGCASNLPRVTSFGPGPAADHTSA